jgi:hypothetical protein
MEYLKGIGGLILVGVLGILALVFFVFFNMAYAAAVTLIAIAVVLVLPYYFGRHDQPEQKGNYTLKKVK